MDSEDIIHFDLAIDALYKVDINSCVLDLDKKVMKVIGDFYADLDENSQRRHEAMWNQIKQLIEEDIKKREG